MTQRLQYRNRKPPVGELTRELVWLLERGSPIIFTGESLDMDWAERCWNRHRAEVLADWCRAKPGSRPWAFWQFSHRIPAELGVPVCGCIVKDGRVVMSEAEYLDRHGLLTAEEQRTLNLDEEE